MHILTTSVGIHTKHFLLMSTQTLVNVAFYTICDRIWENPPYGIRTQFAQCASLVAQVKFVQVQFCHIHVEQPFF